MKIFCAFVIILNVMAVIGTPFLIGKQKIFGPADCVRVTFEFFLNLIICGRVFGWW